MNRGEIRTQVQNLIERSDSTMQTRLNGYISMTWRNICKRRPFISQTRQTTVSTTSAVDYIILPKYVSRVIDVAQQETPMALALTRYYTFLQKYPPSSVPDKDTPTEAHPVGWIGVSTLMPSSSTITVVSSSASDTTQVVRIRGYVSGVEYTEELTLNGTSTVTSTNTYDSTAGREPSFSKDGDTAGTITIKSGSTTIATLGPEDRTAIYSKWHLFPTPSSSSTLYITYQKEPNPLNNDNDTPEIRGAADAIIKGTYYLALEEKRQFQKAALIKQQFEEEIELLIEQEPRFTENFTDQFVPNIMRSELDTHVQ